MVTEFNRASGQRKERVVATSTDIATRMEMRTPLPHDDFPGIHDLASEALHA